MANYRLGFTGLADLSKGLKDRANLNDVKNVVKLNSSELQRNTQRDAPVDTGFLKRSIGISPDSDGFGARIGAEAHYAPYLVWGTRYMVAQDFFRPNFYRQRQKFLADLNRLMK